MLKLTILNLENTLYSGEVIQVDLPGVEGRFQILKDHAKLMSVLKKGVLKIFDSSNQKKEMQIEQGGVVEVGDNIVKILLW